MVVITKPKRQYLNNYPDHLDGEVSFVFTNNTVKQYSYAKRIIIWLPPSHDLKSKQPTNHTGDFKQHYFQIGCNAYSRASALLSAGNSDEAGIEGHPSLTAEPCTGYIYLASRRK
jgi:hypothetical protein